MKKKGAAHTQRTLPQEFRLIHRTAPLIALHPPEQTRTQCAVTS
jgi:hypothetical protein